MSQSAVDKVFKILYFFEVISHYKEKRIKQKWKRIQLWTIVNTRNHLLIHTWQGQEKASVPGHMAGTEAVIEGIERSYISTYDTYWSKLVIHMSFEKKIGEEGVSSMQG